MEQLVIQPEFIFLEASVATAAESIKLAGQAYETAAIVKPSYTKAVITREEKFPTGLPADGFNIAIPHTDAEHVIKAGISVVVPEKPVKFKMMGNPEVELECQIIFPLAMEHPQKQLELLMSLMEFFQDKNKLEKIVKAKDKQTVIDVLRELNI